MENIKNNSYQQENTSCNNYSTTCTVITQFDKCMNFEEAQRNTIVQDGNSFGDTYPAFASKTRMIVDQEATDSNYRQFYDFVAQEECYLDGHIKRAALLRSMIMQLYGLDDQILELLIPIPKCYERILWDLYGYDDTPSYPKKLEYLKAHQGCPDYIEVLPCPIHHDPHSNDVIDNPDSIFSVEVLRDRLIQEMRCCSEHKQYANNYKKRGHIL